MQTFWLVLSALVVFGLAVRQAAYILMFGSIFEDLRHGIEERTDSSVLFQKLNELFTCKVCMTAQVSIWLVALPVTTIAAMRFHAIRFIIGSAPWPVGIPVFLIAVFVIAMAVAAAAVLFWDIIELRRKKFEEQREKYTRQIRELRKELAAQYQRAAEETSSEPVLTGREGR